jgi:threonylcarbamoyladenosine tRNA methylthiotransferase MtaB
MSTPRLKTYTLGCKVNQYETELVREALTNFGYQDASSGESADLCVINTCTVTSEGDAKSRQVIRRMARDNPAAKLIVMGCYATRAPHELRVLPNVCEVVTDKRELPDLLGRFGVVDVPNGISRFGNRHRAYVKVQDGCLLRCSYCIIPHVRPDMSSRSLHDIVDEVQRLVSSGHREIVLTGIHLGHYGVDWNRNKPKRDWIRLSHLMGELLRIDGDFRVRLSSIEATEVTRELIQIMADHSDTFCPHLHICLQSGSDSILRRMKRRWGAKRFLDRCVLVRDALDEPALTTDVIVGFPGETEENFTETCDVVKEVGFSKIHVFPFSARRGTPAAEMPGQISKQEKSDRVSRLMEIERTLRDNYFRKLVGRRLQVLVETEPGDSQYQAGTSCRYAPVRFPSTEQTRQSLGEITAVEITSNAGDKLLGNRCGY